jgi:hypothetical protein
MVSKSRQYTAALTLRACLYINRHESCSVSVSWNVCVAAYEHRSQRGVQFKDAFAFWFVSVPSEQLLTAPALHIHSHFKSFNQRGTLAFASCLNNLTSKGLGHLSFSLSLSLSLSTSFPPAHFHMRSHYSRARASIAPQKRVASEVKHNFACATGNT